MKRRVEGEKNPGNIIMEVGILLMVVNLLCAIGVWQAICHGWMVVGTDGFFMKAFLRAGEPISFFPLERNNCYLAFLSFLFSFLGNREEMVLIGNLVLQCLGVFFFYRGTRTFAGVRWSLVTAVVTTIISVFCYPIINDLSVHILWFGISLAFYLLTKISISCEGKNSFCKMMGMFLAGMVTGIFFYIDLSGVMLWILLNLFVCCLHTDKRATKAWFLFFSGVGILSSYCGFLFLEHGDFWSNPLKVLLNWYSVRVFLLLEPKAFYSYICYLPFFLWMCILVVVRSRKKGDVAEEKNVMAVMEPETSEPNSTEENHVKLLDNPLPLPKKHVKKEMNYAFEPKPSQMHYDLNNYNVNDDYDLK